jgi:hypothetical protein
MLRPRLPAVLAEQQFVPFAPSIALDALSGPHLALLYVSEEAIRGSPLLCGILAERLNQPVKG